MRTKFCIYCGLTAESSAVVDSKSGSIHEGCWAAFLGATSDDRDARRARMLTTETELREERAAIESLLRC
ncbi:MAG: hypothetical protein OEW68_18185 [Gammaproteobacteria bacterium]|jgi:hypothetical protein|nr:hypothetical protein [Gammaproteobacteria bacterium]